MFLHDFKSMKRAKYDWNGKIIVEFIGRTQRGGGGKKFPILLDSLWGGGGILNPLKIEREKNSRQNVKISDYAALGTKNVDYAIPCNFK